MAPLAETTALYEAISAGELGAPAADRPSRRTDAVVGRYPLTGRDDGGRPAAAPPIGPGRVVVVEGEPGVGKTRLVEEVLARLDRSRR